MPSFLYRLRDSYERADTGKMKPSPPPVHLTQRVDGPQQQAAVALPSSRASPSTHSFVFRCCYGLCLIPCLLFSAIRSCCHSVRHSSCSWNNQSSLVLLTSFLSALITLLMVIALAHDQFALIQYNTSSLPTEASLGAFHYCFSPPGTSDPRTCHSIGRHCTAGGYELAALVGHRGESVTCERFDAFRAFFLLAFITSLFSPLTIAVHIVPPHWHHYALTIGVAVVEAVCALLSMIFLLPLLPPSSAAVPATSRLASSFWLQFSSLLFAIIVAALASYDERKRRRNGWRVDGESRSDRAEAESIMAAAARRQGKQVTEMATSAAAEQLEEGAVVSGVFALGSDVEHNLDLDSYRDSTSGGRRQYSRDTETVDDVEREYAQTADEHGREIESNTSGARQPRGEREIEQQVEMRTVGLASARLERDCDESEKRRKTASAVSSRLP